MPPREDNSTTAHTSARASLRRPSNLARFDARASPSSSLFKLPIAFLGLSMIARYLHARLSHHSSIRCLVSFIWSRKLSGLDAPKRASMISPKTVVMQGNRARASRRCSVVIFLSLSNQQGKFTKTLICQERGLLLDVG